MVSIIQSGWKLVAVLKERDLDVIYIVKMVIISYVELGCNFLMNEIVNPEWRRWIFLKK
jgi:hypothetical protein